MSGEGDESVPCPPWSTGESIAIAVKIPLSHRKGTVPFRGGSVLLAVLCLVATLSFVTITAIAASKYHADVLQARLGALRARHLAEMGVAVAVHPQVRPGDPLLRREVSAIERYNVFVSTEESRLNLNTLLTDERLPQLEAIFSSWGMLPADAQSVAATLMDWVDADDLKRRPDSAERLDYEQSGLTGFPLNRPFLSLDEVELVPRMAAVTELRPDWRSFFTMRGSGQLDVNTASAETLEALTGAPLENARRLVDARNGLDGIPQTQDDALFPDVEQAMAELGIQGAQAELMRPLLTPAGQTLRIESVGTAGGHFCGLAVVVEKGNGAPTIAEWSEFPVIKASPR